MWQIRIERKIESWNPINHVLPSLSSAVTGWRKVRENAKKK
jgi:hypothetical protein